MTAAMCTGIRFGSIPSTTPRPYRRVTSCPGSLAAIIVGVGKRIAVGILVALGLAAGLAAVLLRTPTENAESAPVDFADHAFPAVAWTGDRLLAYGGGDNGPARYS